MYCGSGVDSDCARDCVTVSALSCDNVHLLVVIDVTLSLSLHSVCDVVTSR